VAIRQFIIPLITTIMKYKMQCDFYEWNYYESYILVYLVKVEEIEWEYNEEMVHHNNITM
jgi:hypothetical protein